MKTFLNVSWTEVKKGHRNNFHNSMIYFSLLVWPVVLFVTAYYSFKPFNLSAGSPIERFFNPDEVGLFLLTGYLSYIFFWCLVQSAWQMAFERHSGTLELVFLTPVSRIAFLYGRAAANLIEGVWLFFTFSLLAFLFIGHIDVAGWWSIPLAFVTLFVSSVVWGGLLIAVFLFSRDAGILFTILQEPMEIFTGMRIPIAAFPLWAKLAAFVFPLTYVIRIVRDLVMKGQTLADVFPSLALLLGILAVMVIFTVWVIRKAEIHAKRTGSLVLF